MRRWSMLLVAVLVIALAAPAAAKPNKERPFKGTGAGVILAIDSPNFDRCNPDNNPWAIISFDGYGPVTHLGMTYVYAEHCSYADRLQDGTLVPNGTYGEGELTLIAANGDMLKGTYTGGISTSGPPMVGFQDDFTFTGGTGRFADAGGGGTETGVVDFTLGPMPGAPFEVTMIGTISY